MLKRLFFKIKDLIKKMDFPPKIGGLEISDNLLRFTLLNQEKRVLKEEVLRLPEGIIVGGKVADQTKLVYALKQLREKISYGGKSINVIVGISAANVYMQIFNLPPMSPMQLAEAARLNLQMISPVGARSVYSDWELIDDQVRGRPLDLLGAFILSEIVDKLFESLRLANFSVAAIEPIPLALTRVLSLNLDDINKPHLCLNVSGDGIDFFILNKGKIYFNYFTSWKGIMGEKKEIDTGVVKELINKELRRLQSFYVSKWGQVINDLAMVGTVDLGGGIVDYIKDNFNFNVHQLKVSAAFGSALRGLIPRANDHIISLASADTEESFWQSRILHFIGLWRNISITVLAILLLIFGIFDFSLAVVSARVSQKLETAPSAAGLDNQRVNDLKKEVEEFNSLVDKALAAKTQSIAWSGFFQKITNLAGSIQITQIQLQQQTAAVSLSGWASSEQEVLNFKNILANESSFTDVSLPLTAIKTEPDGKVSFSVSFKVIK